MPSPTPYCASQVHVLQGYTPRYNQYWQYASAGQDPVRILASCM